MGAYPEEATLALRLHQGRTDETEKILAARDGDQVAQAWLVRQYTPPVYRFCFRMLRNEQDARDATQDTLMKVMRNLDRFNPKLRFSTWVFGIARNTCIDEYRRRKRLVNLPAERDVVDGGPSPLDEASRAHRAERLHEALEKLPDMYREILVLYHFEHLKYSEIADVLNIPMGTVMNRIFRARRRLRKLYGEESP